jgi:hypothetical protein
VKGWRLFKIADARAPFVRLGGRGADQRAKGTRRPRIAGHAPGAEDLAEKDRPIDPMSGKKFARLETARTGFEPMDKRTGASPSCREYLTIPAFDSHPFRFAHAMLNAAAFRRAPDNAFHPVTGSSCLGFERLQRNCDNIVKHG